MFTSTSCLLQARRSPPQTTSPWAPGSPPLRASRASSTHSPCRPWAAAPPPCLTRSRAPCLPTAGWACRWRPPLWLEPCRAAGRPSLPSTCRVTTTTSSRGPTPPSRDSATPPRSWRPLYDSVLVRRRPILALTLILNQPVVSPLRLITPHPVCISPHGLCK